MAQKGLWNIAKKECWRTEELCPKKRETYKAMHDEKLSQQLVGDGCRRQSGRKGHRAREEESKREFEGDKERVAVV